MTERLLDLLDRMQERRETLDNIVEILGGDINYNLLEDDMALLQLSIIESLGGNEGHYVYVVDSNKFYQYTEKHITRKELLDFINHVIEEDIQGATDIVITLG